MKQCAMLCLFMLVTTLILGQGRVSGRLIDAETSEPLFSATVVLDGTVRGTLSDFDGNFVLSGVPAGEQTISISFVGYSTITKTISVTDGELLELGDITLESSSLGLEEVEVIASVAIDRKTPVAVSSISSKEIETKLGNQEFPEILKRTPSVYVTKSGGGWGDARINVRGFDQRNTAVMINGIPVNDMENGWVYWSNWAGLSEVTRTMQVQRGLGASRLAISSVGGTINIITKTTDQKAGGSYAITYGNNSYIRNSLTLSSGRLDGGWAITFSGAYTRGNGYVQATSFEGGSYFASITKELGEKHHLVFTAIGAPQRHGQRTFREKLSTYDEDRSLTYNSDWGYLDGKPFNIRKNFYHKPQLSLNHYWTINEKTFLSTSAYYSIGRGAGTGDRGSIGRRGTWGYRDNDGNIQVDSIVAWNMGEDNVGAGLPATGKFQTSIGSVAGERDGLILRASVNSHNWMGILSNLTHQINETLTFSGGIDMRYYKGLHYRKIQDLLGNEAWLDPRDINAQSDSIDLDGNGRISSKEVGAFKKVGDKIHYDNDGVVGWEGVFGQLEYTNETGLSAFFNAAFSSTNYQRIDRFQYTGDDQKTKFYNFIGYTVKTGANYNVNDNHNIFFNTGYFSRAPIFDVVFPTYNNDANEDAKNENTFGIELGYGLRYAKVNANLNLYHTRWINKSLFQRYTDASGNDFNANLSGLNAIHQGIELDASFKIVNGLSLNLMGSLGDWYWLNNVEAQIADDNDVIIDTLKIYAKGLKVGDAAQTTASVGLEYASPIGLTVDLDYWYGANLYADFDPSAVVDPSAEGRQALKLPSYGLLNAGLSYRVQLKKIALSFRFNMNNVLDTKYVAEANNYYDETLTNEEMLKNARGFYGFGRTWNVGVKVEF